MVLAFTRSIISAPFDASAVRLLLRVSIPLRRHAAVSVCSVSFPRSASCVQQSRQKTQKLFQEEGSGIENCCYETAASL
jgi:hypothetical protein